MVNTDKGANSRWHKVLKQDITQYRSVTTAAIQNRLGKGGTLCQSRVSTEDTDSMWSFLFSFLLLFLFGFLRVHNQAEKHLILFLNKDYSHA